MISPLKILVVDDEQDIEPLYVQKFRKDIKQGAVNFVFAFSGDDALKIIHDADLENAVLVLSDINMPGMTGLELLQSIKKEFPFIKVIMISAYGDDQNLDLAKNLGADGFITKPVDFELLRKEIYAIV